VRRFGRDTKVAHFIGASKPWHLNFNRATGQLETSSNMMQNIADFAYIWWRIFMEDVHHKLIENLVTPVAC
jgi:lipopolysaccharide biosynthesis glycosyltransferase